MNPVASNRNTVLPIVQEAAQRFRARGDGQPVEGLEEVSPQVAVLISTQLQRAFDWATSPDGLHEEADELEGDDDYVSHDPWISGVQAAMDEYADHHDGTGGPSFWRTIAQVLGIRTRNQIPFIPPASNDDCVHELAENCTVVLVGDWGTGKDRARRIARQIKATNPDHIIHLGDVYPSGTRTRVHKRFLDVWKEEVGDGPRYWAMNGNHEMNARGEGYFLDVLPAWGQTASFFCLRNEHWKLIALDTAYIDHDLERSQLPWLRHQLSHGPGNNILLSHHQLFSAVDDRPFRNINKLPTTMADVVDSKRIFAWFWGHEHRFLSYAPHPEFGNFHARAIGHGGKRIRMIAHTHLGPQFAPPVARYWDVPRPPRPGDDPNEPPKRAMNGFALLTIAGPEITIDYIDEAGTRWHTEIWPHTPHAAPE